MSLAASDAYPPSDNPEPIACFAVVAAADPGILPRVLEPFAKRGLVPSRCNARRTGDVLEVELEMAGMDRDLAEYVGRCLRQIQFVDCVLTSEKQ